MTSAIVAFARENGLYTLDTAIAYGTSEQMLGEIGVDAWRVVTKLPAMPEACADVATWVRGQVAGALDRLRIERLYGLLLHAPAQLLDVRGSDLYDALAALRGCGLVEKIGISIYDPSELSVIWPRFTFDIVQAPFNVFDRRLVASGWLHTLRGSGVEVHTRSTFLQGALLMTTTARPGYFSRWDSLWRRWHSWLADHRVTPLQACLGLVAATPEIDRIIVGVDAVVQLAQILDVDVAGVVPPPDLTCDDLELIEPSRWRLP